MIDPRRLVSFGVISWINKLDRGEKAPLLTKEGWTRFADGVVLCPCSHKL